MHSVTSQGKEEEAAPVDGSRHNWYVANRANASEVPDIQPAILCIPCTKYAQIVYS
jgi:hypothetical protein